MLGDFNCCKWPHIEQKNVAIVSHWALNYAAKRLVTLALNYAAKRLVVVEVVAAVNSLYLKD